MKKTAAFVLLLPVCILLAFLSPTCAEARRLPADWDVVNQVVPVSTGPVTERAQAEKQEKQEKSLSNANVEARQAGVTKRDALFAFLGSVVSVCAFLFVV